MFDNTETIEKDSSSRASFPVQWENTVLMYFKGPIWQHSVDFKIHTNFVIYVTTTT